MLKERYIEIKEDKRPWQKKFKKVVTDPSRERMDKILRDKIGK